MKRVRIPYTILRGLYDANSAVNIFRMSLRRDDLKFQLGDFVLDDSQRLWLLQIFDNINDLVEQWQDFESVAIHPRKYK